MSTLSLLCVLGLVTFTSATLTLQAPCPNNFFYDALYDLESLTVCPSPHVTEYKPITTPSTDCKCCARGTLNISLSASASRRGVLVDLWFNDPSTWAFNLGDSKSNNGWKGDSGHSSYDAEIHNTNANSFIIYRNDQFNAVPAPDKYHKVDNSFSRRLSLVVQDGAVQWVSDVALGQLVDVGLFGLDGQYDAEAGGPADYNLYLGLNQVVNGGRKGRGLCKAGIRFLCEDKETQTTKTTTARATPSQTTSTPLTATTAAPTAAVTTAAPTTTNYNECFSCHSVGHGSWQSPDCLPNGHMTDLARENFVMCQAPCVTKVNRWPVGDVTRGCSSMFYMAQDAPSTGCVTLEDGSTMCFCSGAWCNDDDRTEERDAIVARYYIP